MAFIKYTFKSDECNKYKGVEYYKFDDCYIILANNMQYKRFTLKDVKNCINQILGGNTYVK